MGTQTENLSKFSKTLPTPKTTLFAQSVCRIRNKKTKKKSYTLFPLARRPSDASLPQHPNASRGVVAKTTTKNRACSVPMATVFK